MKRKIKPGAWYKDTVTGFAGTAIFRCECLNGVVKVGLQPEAINNVLPKWETFYEQFLTGDEYADKR